MKKYYNLDGEKIVPPKNSEKVNLSPEETQKNKERNTTRVVNDELIENFKTKENQTKEEQFNQLLQATAQKLLRKAQEEDQEEQFY